MVCSFFQPTQCAPYDTYSPSLNSKTPALALLSIIVILPSIHHYHKVCHLFSTEPARDAALGLSSLLLDNSVELVDLGHGLLGGLLAILLGGLLDAVEFCACTVGLVRSSV